MNKFAIATTMAASALAALIGLAAPADAATTVAPTSAAIDHPIPTRLWHIGGIDDIVGPRAHAPQVDTSVHTSPPIVIRHDAKGDISHFSG